MLEFIKKIGIAPDDSEEQRLQKFTVLIISSGCCTAAPIWSILYYSLGMHVASIGPLIYLFFVFPAIIYFAITKKVGLLINAQLFAIFLCPTFMQWTSGGYISGAGVILWSFLAPLSALLFQDIHKARIWMVVVIVCMIATAVFDGFLKQFGVEIDTNLKLLLIAMNLAGPSVVIYFAMQYFVHTLTKSTRLLIEEKEKSDSLLLNILPVKVAEELKRTGKASPMKYTSSTILFTDFKDFTKISEQLSPEELINELDHCFRTFDEIITAHGLEKIKTIGDAYMCVAGLPAELENGAINAILSAMEMAAYIQKIKDQRIAENKPYWNVRIGIHTGDVVAGIVGQKKFAYDIWGDAVNIASRMESSGEAGKVNISGVTYQLVKDYFNCSYRGKIPAKNKGEIDMYFVDSRKSV